MFGNLESAQKYLTNIATEVESDTQLTLLDLLRTDHTVAEIRAALLIDLAKTSQKVATAQHSSNQQQTDPVALSLVQLKQALGSESWLIHLLERTLDDINPDCEPNLGDVVSGFAWSEGDAELFREFFGPVSEPVAELLLGVLQEYLPGTQPQVRGYLRKVALRPEYVSVRMSGDFHECFTTNLVTGVVTQKVSLAVAVKALYAIQESTEELCRPIVFRGLAIDQLVTEYLKQTQSLNLEELYEAIAPYCAQSAKRPWRPAVRTLFALNTLTPEQIAAHHEQLITYVTAHREELDFKGDTAFACEPWQVYAYLDEVQGHDTRKWRDRLAQGVFDSYEEYFNDAYLALSSRPWWQEETLEKLRSGTSSQQTQAVKLIQLLPDDGFVEPLQKMASKRVAAAKLQKYVLALKACGKPLLRYSTIAQIEKAAAKVKTKPAVLSWMEWDTLPDLVCAKTGNTAPPTVAPWLLKSLIGAKLDVLDEEFSAVLHCYTPQSCQEFAEAVVVRWIAEDTRKRSAAEAAAFAKEDFAHHTAHYRAERPDLSDDEIVQVLTTYFATVVVGSQAKTSYVTSLGGAVGGTVIPRAVRAYLTAWPDRRTQAARIINMLAQRHDDESIAALAQCAQSHKKAGVKAKAGELLADIAKRDNRSVAELKLLAIPRFGLSEAGQRCYEENGKKYTLTLGPGFATQITNPAGKTVKSIPFDSAREDIRELKKVCKKAPALLGSIFLDAVYSSATWPAGTWLKDVAAHPITGQVAASMVWQTSNPDDPTTTRTFRPVGDGTFTDAQDNDVPAPTGDVWVAHSASVPASEQTAWQTVFDDYDLIWVLPQFAHTPVELQPGQTTINDREGHVMETFALRNAAVKAGFHYITYNESVEGWYKKVGDDHAVVLGCTQIVLPMEQHEVALTTLTFCHHNNTREPLPLADCPPAALAFANALYHQLAALGSGYRANWKDLPF